MQPEASAIPTLPREFNAATHFIDRHLHEGRGERVAYVDEEGALSYRDLHARVNRAGRALLQLGLAMEQRVLLCLLDGRDLPAPFFGAIKAGLVPVPVNPLLSSEDYRFLLCDSCARVAVVSADLYPRLAPALAQAPQLQAVLVAGPVPSGAHPVPGYGLEEVLAAAPPELSAAPTCRDEVAFWLYTSGSTGTPKATLHLHASLFYTAVLYGERVLGMRADDVVFSAAKLFFAYGLGNAMSFPLHVGATTVLYEGRPTPVAVREVLSRHRPTLFCGVRTLFAALLNDPGFDATEVASVRLCTSAGEALPRPLGKRWRARCGSDIRFS